MPKATHLGAIEVGQLSSLYKLMDAGANAAAPASIKEPAGAATIPAANIRAQVRQPFGEAGRQPVPKLLLVPLPPRSEAAFASPGTQDAELIVAAAFGHLRIYEGLFAGVTLDLMHQKSLPALMLHSSLGEERPLTRSRICGAATLAPSSVATISRANARFE